MNIGISSASLYPLHTEDALRKIGEMGITCAEVFFNAVCEGEGEIFRDILDSVKKYNMKILSLHPFSSPMESLFLFSTYDRRVNEFIEMYKRYFDCMNKLGAEVFVVHGAIRSSNCSDEHYIQQMGLLINEGKKFGITVAQENISYCKSGDIAFLAELSRQMKDDIHFVVDVKQAVRSGTDAFELKNLLGNKIVHYHLSDNKPGQDCLPVGKGNFDFERLFRKLRDDGYTGGAVVELYRINYGEYDELRDSVNMLNRIQSKI